MIELSIVFLIIAIFMSVFRLVKGSSWDILLGYSSFSSKITLLMVTIGMLLQKEWALDLSLIYMLLNTGSVVIVSYFMGRRNLN
ncbi:MAG TPA: hypothetical protein ENF81_10105 [Thermotogaceae bacterium]|nr:hypothetical protein [Thermotogota bacterium]HEW92871.1 hypothetical protein [Thermotogaceae bacterium]